MIARYVPTRMSGFMMGAYFVAIGVSQYLGSIVANFAHISSNDLSPVQSLPTYIKLFGELGWLATGGAMLAFLLLPFTRNFSRQHRACAEMQCDGSNVLVSTCRGRPETPPPAAQHNSQPH
jgi:POT family proton-dependent oligopeptide transporter